MDFKEEELDYMLGKEFNEYIFIHKSSVVLGALLKFYKDKAETGVQLPPFMTKTPEEEANEHYYQLLGNKDAFNSMYKKCWDEYAEVLP